MEQTGVTFTMLWDSTRDSWRHYSVRSNSSSLMLDRSGDPLGNVFFGPDMGYVAEILGDA